jgi:aquaporin rerated protein, other eukaryote
VFFTGGSLNPARSFGPDVILRTFDNYHWIYWLGPLIGAIVAVVFYRFMKVLEYETANPGADGDGQEDRFVRSSTPLDDHSHNGHGHGGELLYSDFDSTFPAVPSADGVLARHATDGADDTEFLPPFHPINKSLTQPHLVSPTGIDTVLAEIGLPDLPERPIPACQLGNDGQVSDPDSSIDHPNDRPRAHNSHSTARSSRSHYTESTDQSYRNGPDLELGSSRSSSSTGSKSRGKAMTDTSH